MSYKTVAFNELDRVEAVDFIQDRMPTDLPVSNYDQEDQFFGVLKGKELCFVYGFVRARRDFNGNIFDMEICLAANKGISMPINRESIQIGLDYPFEVVKCRRITAYIESNNKKSLCCAIRLGFKKEGLLKDASASNAGEDVHVLGLTFRQWKNNFKKTWRYKPNGR